MTLALKFSQAAPFDTASIPEQWQDFVAVQEAGGGAYDVAISVHPDDDSYRYRAIMQHPELVLKFSLPFYVDFPIGTRCEVMGQEFSLGCPADFKKQGNRQYEFTLRMGTKEDRMADYKLRNSVDGRLKWSMCARPEEFLREIVANLNARDGADVWTVGAFIDAAEKTIEFNHTSVDSALQSIADEFNTEWEVAEGEEGQLIVSLHKVEYLKDRPQELAYGRGNGFVPGVGRASQSDEKPVKRLYPEGSDRNIDRASYGSAELRLPKGQSLQYDGEHFEGDPLMDADRAHTYASDPEGIYIYRSDVPSSAVREESLDCTAIYPSRIGHISSCAVVNADKNLYDIVDEDIPDDLNFSDCQLADTKMSIIFQSGMLAGKEFDVNYIHSDRRFEIVPQEFDGVMMPNETFKPTGGEGGDAYAVFGIQLPDQYLCDDVSKTGASWDMFREAARWLYEHEEQKFTFSGELQGLWAKQHWSSLSQYMRPGAYIRFKDDHFAKGDGVDIRIVGIKDYLTAPYSPQIEISNTVAASSATSQQLRDIAGMEVTIADARRDAMSFTKRRFKDALDTMEMLSEATNSLADEYSSAINPIAVKTMQMIVGDEALQFEFIDSPDNPVRVDDTMRIEGKRFSVGGKALGASPSYIRHLTLGISDISSDHQPSEYRVWSLPAHLSPILNDASKSYYVYAVCQRRGDNGYFTLSETARDLEGTVPAAEAIAGTIEAGDGCYNLLCGVVNKEYDGERSFARLYGFTEILPGRITTDRVVSSDGNSYFNLAGNSFSLGAGDGPGLQFNTEGDGRLKLRGVLMQSPSGSEFYVPCYRGSYSAGVTYYPGDSVTCADADGTSLWTCIKQSAGIPPNSHNRTYWELLASHGSKGDQGDAGQDGASPALVYRGDYAANTTYYGYSRRLDCVRHNGTYWVAALNEAIGSTGFANQTPGDGSSYWASFGASFESVATSLLLAENANIAGWILKDNRLISQRGRLNGADSREYTASGFSPNIILDGVNGRLLQGANISLDNNGLCMTDNDGNVLARIANGEITPISNLQSAKGSFFDTSSQSAEWHFHSGDISVSQSTDGEASYALGDYAKGSKLTFPKTQSDDTAYITLRLPSGYDYNAVFKLTLSTEVNGQEYSRDISLNSVRSEEDGYVVFRGKLSDNANIIIGSDGLPAGDYTLKLHYTLYFRSDSETSQGYDVAYRCGYNYAKMNYRKTLIGTNGMYACYGPDQYLYASANAIILRCGDYALKISGAGIQKSTDGGSSFPTQL